MNDPTTPGNVPSGNPSGPRRPAFPAGPPPRVRRRPPAQRPPAPSPVVAPQWPSYGQPPATGPRPIVTGDPNRTATDNPNRTAADNPSRTAQDFGRPFSSRRGPDPHRAWRGEQPPPPASRSRPPSRSKRGSLSAGLLWILAWSSVISVLYPLISTVVFDRPVLWAWPVAAVLFAAFLYSYSRR